MTAGERLASLAGLSGATAAVMLLAIGSGATAGAALVDYSRLPSNTAAVHLLAERAAAVDRAGGALPRGGLRRNPRLEEAQRIARRQADEDVLLILH